MNSRLSSVLCAMFVYSVLSFFNRELKLSIRSASRRQILRMAAGDEAVGLLLTFLSSLDAFSISWVSPSTSLLILLPISPRRI